MPGRSHRFLPRFRAFALSAIGFSIALMVGGFAVDSAVAFLIAFITIPSAGLYLASPSWRLVVETSDAGLTVRDHRRERFHVPWKDIVSVIASPSTHTCFVNGGGAERSLLVPGIDAPASYDLTDKDELYETILAHVPPERVTIVESLLSIHDKSFPTARARSSSGTARHHE